MGKGIRGAPRDVLVADIAPPELRGAAYGLRQSLDSLGAFIGPLVAMAFLAWLTSDIKAVLWVAVVPALVAVALLVLGVKEPERSEGDSGMRTPFTFVGAKHLPLRYWLIVLLGAIFTLARFSEAFLVLRAQDVGLTLGYLPLVLIVMNIAYTATSYPAGIAADHLNQRALLILGIGTLAIADLVLAATTSPFSALTGAALWGIHMGLTQGLFAKLVADNVPSELRGTAFGIFNLVSVHPEMVHLARVQGGQQIQTGDIWLIFRGFEFAAQRRNRVRGAVSGWTLVSGGALLLASFVAGVLWAVFGAAATFLAGAVFAALAAIGLLIYQ